jgi:hypothetical protein
VVVRDEAELLGDARLARWSVAGSPGWLVPAALNVIAEFGRAGCAQGQNAPGKPWRTAILGFTRRPSHGRSLGSVAAAQQIAAAIRSD